MKGSGLGSNSRAISEGLLPTRGEPSSPHFLNLKHSCVTASDAVSAPDKAPEGPRACWVARMSNADHRGLQGFAVSKGKSSDELFPVPRITRELFVVAVGAHGGRAPNEAERALLLPLTIS